MNISILTATYLNEWEWRNLPNYLSLLYVVCKRPVLCVSRRRSTFPAIYWSISWFLWLLFWPQISGLSSGRGKIYHRRGGLSLVYYLVLTSQSLIKNQNRLSCKSRIWSHVRPRTLGKQNFPMQSHARCTGSVENDQNQKMINMVNSENDQHI